MRYRRVWTAGCSVAAAILIAVSWVAPVSAQTRAGVKPAQPATAEVAPVSTVTPVAIDLPFPAGAIVIVNAERQLYLVTGKGQALRYPIAVGKPHELWMGKTFVSAKKVDPEWISVDSDGYSEPGDPKNPLGKRALYLDWSLLRIHGTPSRKSIGSAASNGCIRMLNEDVIDLFDRVHLGAPVFAIQSVADAEHVASARVGEKVYADPEARRQARERDDAADDTRARRERLASERVRIQRGTATLARAN